MKARTDDLGRVQRLNSLEVVEGWGQEGQGEAGTEPGKGERVTGHSTASLNRKGRSQKVFPPLYPTLQTGHRGWGDP